MVSLHGFRLRGLMLCCFCACHFGLFTMSGIPIDVSEGWCNLTDDFAELIMLGCC